MAADLANTLGSNSGNEYLHDVPTLADFVASHGMKVPKRISQQDLQEVRGLRDRLLEIFHAHDEAKVARMLNALLEESGASPRITAHDGEPWHFHFVADDASLVHRLGAVAAVGLGAVLSEFGIQRFGLCADAQCNDAFIDLSRNRSRRYCSDRCATRSNVAAYRARRKAEGAPAG